MPISTSRILAMLAAVLMAAFAGLATPALAQDDAVTVSPRAATGGAQTLEEILRRQEEALGKVTITPREDRPEGTAPEMTGPLGAQGGTSLPDIWDRWRGGDPVNIAGPMDPASVMTTSGQQWRLLREEYLRKYLGWAPLGMLGLLAVFYLLRGPMKLEGGRSGKTIPRFNLTARIAHWFLAGVFIILAITGLFILLGRPLLIPVFGPEVNSILVSASMQGHNLFGPLFIIAIVWMFIKFVRGNFFQLVDIRWILKLGGFFGGHVSSKQFNFGEKTWFWMVILIGLVISATGVLLLFPWLVADMRWLQLSTVLHVLGAIVLISVALGHIYVGSIGMEGSLDSMLKGEVDENWAKEHHDLWYEEVKNDLAAAKEKEISA